MGELYMFFLWKNGIAMTWNWKEILSLWLQKTNQGWLGKKSNRFFPLLLFRDLAQKDPDPGINIPEITRQFLDKKSREKQE